MDNEREDDSEIDLIVNEFHCLYIYNNKKKTNLEYAANLINGFT